MTESNLIPFNELTQEEQRKIASEGGKASVVSRAKKRDLKKRIAATWELATEMKKKGFKKEIKDLLNGNFPTKDKDGDVDVDIRVQLLEDKIKLLGMGGAEMLTALTKATVIENLFNHEHGKAQGNDTLKVEWGSGIGKSPAFSDDSVLLGISHGLAALPTKDLDKVIEMAETERKNRLINKN